MGATWENLILIFLLRKWQEHLILGNEYKNLSKLSSAFAKHTSSGSLPINLELVSTHNNHEVNSSEFLLVHVLGHSSICLFGIAVGHDVISWSFCPVPVAYVMSCVGCMACCLVRMGMCGTADRTGNILPNLGVCDVLYFGCIKHDRQNLDLCFN